MLHHDAITSTSPAYTIIDYMKKVDSVNTKISEERALLIDTLE